MSQLISYHQATANARKRNATKQQQFCINKLIKISIRNVLDMTIRPRMSGRYMYLSNTKMFNLLELFFSRS